MVKVALVAQSGHADDPGLVLAGMNQIFCGRLDRHFVTAAYAYIDADEGRLRYAAAGHPPAVLVRRGGEIEEMSVGGIVLGYFPDWSYVSAERAFRPGDRLILYTDGLIEASDGRGDLFDRERLRAFAGRDASAGPAAFVDTLIDHVRAWSGPTRRFEDDVTIVVVDAT